LPALSWPVRRNSQLWFRAGQAGLVPGGRMFQGSAFRFGDRYEPRSGSQRDGARRPKDAVRPVVKAPGSPSVGPLAWCDGIPPEKSAIKTLFYSSTRDY
jgi:hypothetical protein